MTALFEMHIRLGGDPRGSGEFEKLCDELARLAHPACPDVDWAVIEQLCLTLFHRDGAQLQTAAAFTLARSHRHGLDGMLEGLGLIEALLAQWSTLWPAQNAERLAILIWSFGQLQTVVRRQQGYAHNVALLDQLMLRLERLSVMLQSQTHTPLIQLQALHQQVGHLERRLRGDFNMRPPLVQAAISPEQPAWALPVLLLPPADVPATPASLLPRTPRLTGWIYAAMLTLLLVGGLVWQTWQRTLVVKPAEPVQLESLMLFDAGSAELKADSAKVLITALADIKAHPDWLIVITGHADASGDAVQNLRLSQQRAQAVGDWMQRMGDIPARCLAVHGVADSQPVAGNDSVTGRLANRRVDIRLVPGCKSVVL